MSLSIPNMRNGDGHWFCWWNSARPCQHGSFLSPLPWWRQLSMFLTRSRRTSVHSPSRRVWASFLYSSFGFIPIWIEASSRTFLYRRPLSPWRCPDSALLQLLADFVQLLYRYQTDWGLCINRVWMHVSSLAATMCVHVHGPTSIISTAK